MSKILSFVNQKGGVGKTTTAVNTSYYLAKKGKSVLLIDLDPQGNASSSLGIKINDLKTSHELLLGSLSYENYFSEAFGIKIIPSTQKLANIEGYLSTSINKEFYLEKQLNKIKHQFDFIIIDCPPSLGNLTVNALVASDELIIVVQSEYLALEGVPKITNTVDNIVSKLDRSPKISGVLITMHDSRLSLGKDITNKIKTSIFGKLLFKTFIRRNTDLAKAPGNNLPIAKYAPTSNGAIDYQNFTNELIERYK